MKHETILICNDIIYKLYPDGCITIYVLQYKYIWRYGIRYFWIIILLIVQWNNLYVLVIYYDRLLSFTRTKSPCTKYITMFDKNDMIYALQICCTQHYQGSLYHSPHCSQLVSHDKTWIVKITQLYLHLSKEAWFSQKDK